MRTLRVPYFLPPISMSRVFSRSLGFKLLVASMALSVSTPAFASGWWFGGCDWWWSCGGCWGSSHQSNQSADVDSSASTTVNSTINAGSSNSTDIDQDGGGNQDADVDADADTHVTSNISAYSSNSTHIDQD
jgi:hypothetical protein